MGGWLGWGWSVNERDTDRRPRDLIHGKECNSYMSEIEKEKKKKEEETRIWP